MRIGCIDHPATVGVQEGAGLALKGGELADVSPTAEQSALGKLLANWSSVMVGKAATEDRRKGQQALKL